MTTLNETYVHDVDREQLRLMLIHADITIQAMTAALLRDRCAFNTVFTITEGLCLAKTFAPHLVVIGEPGAGYPVAGELISCDESAGGLSVYAVLERSSELVPLPDPSVKVSTVTRADEIINAILNLATLRGFPLVLGHRLNRRIAPVFQYLYENFPQAVTVSSVAKANALSAHHLTYLFKTTIGMTLKAYLGYLRIELGKRLLDYSNGNLDQIAEQTGFYDASHFSRAFCKHVGCGPGAYRTGGISLL